MVREEAAENDGERDVKDRELNQERGIMRDSGTESEKESNRTEVGIGISTGL